jgi:hypothetical protein
VKNFPSKIKRNNEAHEVSIDFSSHIAEMDSLVLQGLHDFLPDTSTHGHPTNILTSKIKVWTLLKQCGMTSFLQKKLQSF